MPYTLFLFSVPFTHPWLPPKTSASYSLPSSSFLLPLTTLVSPLHSQIWSTSHCPLLSSSFSMVGAGAILVILHYLMHLRRTSHRTFVHYASTLTSIVGVATRLVVAEDCRSAMKMDEGLVVSEDFALWWCLGNLDAYKGLEIWTVGI